jgi:ferredoxin
MSGTSHLEPPARAAATRPAAPAGTHRLRVNPIACAAHGVCAELLPELISQDPWGYPIVSGKPVPPRLLKLARKAAASCPTLALLVEPIEAPGR